MKPRLFAAIWLAALWLSVLFVFMQRVSPVISFPAARISASPGDVVINEVAWGGTHASAADEWIELYNNTTDTIPLNGWMITATNSVSF